MRDDPLKACPECNEEALRRLISGGSGIIFKGSGFYVTDSRSGGSGSTASKSGSSATESEGGSKKSSGKSDEKKTSESGGKKSSVDAA
ncbi:MAG: FmdB family zinc ribbon protein [Alkalispirochaetaceae bacterium]